MPSVYGAGGEEEKFLDSLSDALQKEEVKDQPWPSGSEQEDTILQDLLNALDSDEVQKSVEVLQKYFQVYFLDLHRSVVDFQVQKDFYTQFGEQQGQKIALKNIFSPKHRYYLLCHQMKDGSYSFESYQLGAVYLLLYKSCSDVCPLNRKEKSLRINPSAYKLNGEDGPQALCRNFLWALSFIVENNYHSPNGPWNDCLSFTKGFTKAYETVHQCCTILTKGDEAAIDCAVTDYFDLGEMIGKGGFGQVLKAKPTKQGLEKFPKVSVLFQMNC